MATQPERPLSYREDTWKLVSERLRTLSPSRLHQLAVGLPAHNPKDIASLSTSEIATLLVKHGAYLMCALGLTRNPEVMRGTVFSHGGIEYILEESIARDLAGKAPFIPVKRLGEQKRRDFTYQGLMRALAESEVFDQLDWW